MLAACPERSCGARFSGAARLSRAVAERGDSNPSCEVPGGLAGCTGGGQQRARLWDWTRRRNRAGTVCSEIASLRRNGVLPLAGVRRRPPSGPQLDRRAARSATRPLSPVHRLIHTPASIGGSRIHDQGIVELDDALGHRRAAIASAAAAPGAAALINWSSVRSSSGTIASAGGVESGVTRSANSTGSGPRPRSWPNAREPAGYP